MKPLDLFQMRYTTLDNISTPALTQFFAAIDSATQAGYAINHSSQAHMLMIDPDHLYDVVASLGVAITCTPDTLLHAFKTLRWPYFVGIKTLKTPLWPNAKRVTCWTFDLNKSDIHMTQHPDMTEQLRNQIESMRGTLALLRQSLNAAAPHAPVTYQAQDLSSLFAEQHDLLTLILAQSPA
jgi:hypothetical protein